MCIYCVFMFFFSLLDEIKDPYVKKVLGILNAAKSKTISKWRELVSSVDVMFCFAFSYILIHIT